MPKEKHINDITYLKKDHQDFSQHQTKNSLSYKTYVALDIIKENISNESLVSIKKLMYANKLPINKRVEQLKIIKEKKEEKLEKLNFGEKEPTFKEFRVFFEILFLEVFISIGERLVKLKGEIDEKNLIHNL